MNDLSDLRTMISVVRSRPKERRLCCPKCRGEMRAYTCTACGFVATSLLELAVGGNRA